MVVMFQINRFSSIMPKYGNMAKNPKTNMVQIMPLTQKDASHQYWPIYEVKSLFTRNGPRRPFFWHKISHYLYASVKHSVRYILYILHANNNILIRASDV